MFSWQGQTDKIESDAYGWTEGIQTFIIIFKLADNFSYRETNILNDKRRKGYVSTKLGSVIRLFRLTMLTDGIN